MLREIILTPDDLEALIRGKEIIREGLWIRLANKDYKIIMDWLIDLTVQNDMAKERA